MPPGPVPAGSVAVPASDRVSDFIVDPTCRQVYDAPGLGADLPAAPLALLAEWYAAAVADERIAEPAAMVLATVDAAGHPNARTVLLKGLDAQGAEFYTNLGSTKAVELAGVAVRAALVLLWHPMYRQVRLRGPVEPVSRDGECGVLRLAPAGLAGRLPGLAPVPAGRLAGRARGRGRAEEARWPDTGSGDGRAAAGLLGWLPAAPGRGRALGGPAVAAARPGPVLGAEGTPLDDRAAWTAPGSSPSRSPRCGPPVLTGEGNSPWVDPSDEEPAALDEARRTHGLR